MFGWLFGNNEKTDMSAEEKDTGIFGIDWDGDGKVSELDDFMTIDIFSDDEN